MSATLPESQGQPIDAEARASRQRLEERLSQLGIDAGALVPDDKGTLSPAEDATADEGVADTLAADGGARAPRRRDALEQPSLGDPTAVVLGPVLGGGGMGVVHVAEQPALRREVAVKRLRSERVNASAVGSLLREAWVTGTLEHPNIVPIHLLLADEASPKVVMKRIEGVTWEALMASPALVAELTDAKTAESAAGRMLFHLRVLIDVCHAVHFAHSRGILHLDLKPENVMVGRFGEVYVVDWGIAASIPGVGPRWLPAASEIKTVRGTPAWLAPEMASADGARIGPRTDVYLLGGLLHAILTDNQPRHRGREMLDLLVSAFTSLPYAYPASAPSELAELANRATARDPEARPASAEAFRRAIEDHLAHRHSTELEARASVAKDRLVGLFTRGGARPHESTQAGQNLRREFLECRFAFRQALEIWPDNQRAKEGLRSLLLAMAGYALEMKQYERAAECIAELTPRDAELERRLRALGDELLGQNQRLQELERDADLDLFHKQRSMMALAAGVVFILWNVTCGLVHRSGLVVFDLGGLLWFNAATFVCFVGSAWIVRKTLLTTALNRRLVVLFGSGFVAILSFWFAAWVHGLARPTSGLTALEVVALSNWAYPFFMLVVTFTMDKRAAWMLAPVTLIAVLAPLLDTYAFEILGLEGLLCGGWLAWIWRRPAHAPTRGLTV